MDAGGFASQHLGQKTLPKYTAVSQNQDAISTRSYHIDKEI